MARRPYAQGTKDPEIWERWLQELTSEEEYLTDEEDDDKGPPPSDMDTDTDEAEPGQGTEESSSDIYMHICLQRSFKKNLY